MPAATLSTNSGVWECNEDGCHLVSPSVTQIPSEPIPSEPITQTCRSEEAEDTEPQSERWIKGDVLGISSSGNVHLAMIFRTGKLLAVKQILLPASSDGSRKEVLDTLQEQVRTLAAFQHDNIIQCLYSTIEPADSTHLNVFFEFAPGGSISTLLDNYGAFEDPLARNFTRQMLAGLTYLHSRGVAHRDIRPSHVLVTNAGGVKLSGFGLLPEPTRDSTAAIARGHRRTESSLRRTVYWRAPEVIKSQVFSFESDIWSVGCVVLQMLSGKHPWAPLTPMQAIFKLGREETPPLPCDVLSPAETFLELALQVIPTSRPSATELASHPWFAPSDCDGNDLGDETPVTSETIVV